MKRNLFSKLKSRFKNAGSGVVLVIVAVAFIGILVGSLLTAVGYAYRLKLYDYNAKDNFYYLEQAMDELYVGVGNKSMEVMQGAFTEVLTSDLSEEHMDEQFKSDFIKGMVDFFVAPKIGETTVSVADFLRSYISNTDIVLDEGTAENPLPNLVYLDKTGNEIDNPAVGINNASTIDSIIIKNVRLSRIGTYKRSTANGDYEQTISADITITKPAFKIKFSTSGTSSSTLFDFSMISDGGIEIHTPTGISGTDNEFNMTGNIYATADFYDKEYNKESGEKKYGEDKDAIDIGRVASNGNSIINKVTNNPTDGVYEESAYSGLFIKDTKVNLQSDKVIVAGSISVMGDGSLSIYRKNDNEIGNTDLWADNIVLGNKDEKNGGSTEGTRDADGNMTYTKFPKLNARANFHVRDDLEINADGSAVRLAGNYYGFGNGTTADGRKYTDTAMSTQSFLVGDNNTARGHFNSSAIVVNGQNASLNLSDLSTLFIAGRTYIELSRNKEPATTGETTDDSNTAPPADVTDGGNGTIHVGSNNSEYDDYRTGESLSLKTNQLAYVPMHITGVEIRQKEVDGNVTFEAVIPTNLQNSILFKDILQCTATKINDEESEMTVPVIQYNTRNGKEYYYDFDTIIRDNYHELLSKTNEEDKDVVFDYLYATSEEDAESKEITGNYGANIRNRLRIRNADELRRQFIIYYQRELGNYGPGSARSALKDVVSVSGFENSNGSILVNTRDNSIFSAGAITVKKDANFRITGTIEGNTGSLENDVFHRFNETDVVNANDSYSTNNTSDGVDLTLRNVSADINTTAINGDNLCDEMESRYRYLKWTLQNYNQSEEAEQKEYEFVNDFYKTYSGSGASGSLPGQGYLSPVNKYMNMTKLNTDVAQTIKLNSGSIWYSSGDVTVGSDDPNNKTSAKGIVIAGGNVYFDKDLNRFDGLIIAGDKIFINAGPEGLTSRSMTSFNASPEVARAVIADCIALLKSSSSDPLDLKKKEYCALVLQLFKAYEDVDVTTTTSVAEEESSIVSIDAVQSSDIVNFSNWMKNVVDVPKKKAAEAPEEPEEPETP
ncbi:MAG: hypothetical protein IKQ49_12510 [Eubacterium sp.]|nr:hypothetical protein [Eubacterium sp.]